MYVCVYLLVFITDQQHPVLLLVISCCPRYFELEELFKHHNLDGGKLTGLTKDALQELLPPPPPRAQKEKMKLALPAPGVYVCACLCHAHIAYYSGERKALCLITKCGVFLLTVCCTLLAPDSQQHHQELHAVEHGPASAAGHGTDDAPGTSACAPRAGAATRTSRNDDDVGPAEQAHVHGLPATVPVASSFSTSPCVPPPRVPPHTLPPPPPPPPPPPSTPASSTTPAAPPPQGSGYAAPKAPSHTATPSPVPNHDTAAAAVHGMEEDGGGGGGGVGGTSDGAEAGTFDDATGAGGADHGKEAGQHAGVTPEPTPGHSWPRSSW